MATSRVTPKGSDQANHLFREEQSDEIVGVIEVIAVLEPKEDSLSHCHAF